VHAFGSGSQNIKSAASRICSSLLRDRGAEMVEVIGISS
jgi:hypothetical protein